MSDAFQTHGAFSWFELHTADVAGAKKFYADVFGWELEDMEMGGRSYTMIKAAGQPVGGITGDAGTDGWVSYVTVDDVDASTNQAEDAGGKIVMAPMTVPGVGRMASVTDPSGALICLITYERRDG